MERSPGSDSPRVVAAVARLRSSGERVTPARYAVLRVIDAADLADEHLSAEQVGTRVGELEPAVHRATVYRTLTALTEAGVLSHVHLGGSATVYHLAVTAQSQPGRPHESSADEARVEDHAHGAEEQEQAPGHAPGHAHVQCVSCGRVQDVPPHVLDSVAERLLDDLDFALETTHAALLGTCAQCRR